jgi:hypothetical protein
MGSTRLWLPSRRSVDSHRGGLSMVLVGHCRSVRFNGANFLYFFEGSLSIGIVGRRCVKKQQNGANSQDGQRVE